MNLKQRAEILDRLESQLKEIAQLTLQYELAIGRLFNSAEDTLAADDFADLLTEMRRLVHKHLSDRANLHWINMRRRWAVIYDNLSEQERAHMDPVILDILAQFIA